MPNDNILSHKSKDGRGLYMNIDAFDVIDGWISPPSFRSRGEVVAEMARTLKESGWQPGQQVLLSSAIDGIRHQKTKEAAPVSTPRAAPPLRMPKKS